MRRIALPLVLALASIASADRPITILFLHSNDLHAHMEPTLIRRVPYGGYARQATLINAFRDHEKNVVLLNAGDTFQGTLYFNVYEGLADLAALNAMGYQAMAVGNHEFDRGPRPLATFAKYAKFPLLSANVDASGDAELNGLIKPYTVIMVGGQKVGVIGATTPDAPNISSPGPTVKFLDLRRSVQGAIDELTKLGVNKIVLLSHIGYEEDIKLVSQTRGIDLVVGGHSHSPLGTPDLDGWPKSRGPYPTMAKDAGGASVPVVQSWEWGKAFGSIRVSFDGKGKLTKVDEAKAIVVDQSIPEDPFVAGLVASYQRPISNLANQEIGRAASQITREQNVMGEVIADAMLDATVKSGAVAAFVNGGGVRGSLEAGKITYGNLIAVQPFNNTLVLLDVTGAELKAAIEHGSGGAGLLIPSRGTSYKIDRSKPEGSRVSDIMVGGDPWGAGKTYRIAIPNFIASGGDSHFALRDAKGARTDTGLLDIDALVEYVRKVSTLTPGTDRRIKGI